MKLSISGEAQYQGDNGGTYFLQEDKTNNKPYWIHQSGGMAIWWDNEYNKWKIGPFEHLGSEIAGIIGPSNNDSPPNQITNGWKFANNGFHDTNGVHFEDWTFKQGKFLHSLCKIFLQAESKEMSHSYYLIISQRYNIRYEDHFISLCFIQSNI